jgi:alpha-beta hydrolase superfamily lysophospholipase
MNYNTQIINARDRKKINVHFWTAETEKAVTVIMVHGLGEHGGRYHSWAELFVSNGYHFICPDLRGHGKSEGRRGHVRSMNDFLDDLDQVYDIVKHRFPESRIILYGHSMGGNIALNHVICRNRPLDALIVTSPWLKLTTEPHAFLLMLSKLLRKILPFILLSNQINPDNLSHDPEVVRNYINDPLTHDRISPGLFHSATGGGLLALRNVYKINCPFLIMHGTSDAITSHKASESYVMNTSSRTRLRLWEGQYHELHNEFVREEVFAFIRGWLKEYTL